MGTYGYAPCDGDAPHDMESFLNSEAIAPYLIKLFKKPLRKGSAKFIRPEVMKAELEKAGIKRPKAKKGKMIDRRTFKRFWKKARALQTKIKRRKNSDLYYEIQFASHDRWNRLGLVQIVSEKGFWIPVSVVKKCRADLRELAKDEGFASIWNSPKAFKKSVKNMLENVDLVLACDKIQQRAIKKRSARSRRKKPRRRSPRMIYDAFFRPRPGERRIPGTRKLLSIPQTESRPIVRKKRKRKKRKGA